MLIWNAVHFKVVRISCDAIFVDSPLAGGFTIRPIGKERTMFTIGEFSRASGLTVKTLRFYHEQGLLVPAFVDLQTGYRHYEPAQLETARIITALRKLEITLAEIQQLLKRQDQDEELLQRVERHKTLLAEKVNAYRQAIKFLDQFIANERQAKSISQSTPEIQEKAIEPMLMAGIRMKARYDQCGNAFGRIARSMGRHICGKPFILHYDDEYKDEDADFEVCMPVRAARAKPEISVRELSGGRCASLQHKGPYDQLGRSYARILNYMKEKNYAFVTPTREVYWKGPGMIFRGNPANFLTEIQILIDERLEIQT